MRFKQQVQQMADLLADEPGQIAAGSIPLNPKFFASKRRVRSLLRLVDTGLVFDPAVIKLLSQSRIVEHEVAQLWPNDYLMDDGVFSETRFLFMLHTHESGEFVSEHQRASMLIQQGLRMAEKAGISPTALHTLNKVFYYTADDMVRHRLLAHQNLNFPTPYTGVEPMPTTSQSMNMAYMERSLLFFDRWLPAQILTSEYKEMKKFAWSVTANLYLPQWQAGYTGYWTAMRGVSVSV